MDLRQYLHALRTYWRVILAALLIGALTGVYAEAQAVPKYRGSVTFFIATSGEGGASAAVQGDTFAQRRVNSYAGLLRTDRFARMVVRASGLDLKPGQVSHMIGARADLDTVLLTATITSPSKRVVGAVAKAVSTEFVRLVRDLETTGTDSPSVSLKLVSGPNVSELPSRAKLMVGLRAMLGLLVGLAIALGLELWDTRIRSGDELLGLGLGQILGTIPFDRRARSAPLMRDGEQSARAEAFRYLRTNLEFIDVERPVRVVVTSPSQNEGRATVSANLAISLATAGERVLLIDADLRRRHPTMTLPPDDGPGLTDVLVGQATLDDALRRWGPDGLMLLQRGRVPSNPAELLGSEAMVHLFDELAARADVVVLNTPPVLPVTDAAVLAAHADGVVVVVRAGKTKRDELRLTTRSLHVVGARVFGMVLNMAGPVRRFSLRARVRGRVRRAATPPPPSPAYDQHVPASAAERTQPDEERQLPVPDVSAPEPPPPAQRPTPLPGPPERHAPAPPRTPKDFSHELSALRARLEQTRTLVRSNGNRDREQGPEGMPPGRERDKDVELWATLAVQLDDLEVLAELARDDPDGAYEVEIASMIEHLSWRFSDLERRARSA